MLPLFWDTSTEGAKTKEILYTVACQRSSTNCVGDTKTHTLKNQKNLLESVSNLHEIIKQYILG